MHYNDRISIGKLILVIISLCNLQSLTSATPPLQVDKIPTESTKNDQELTNNPRAKLPEDLLPLHYELMLVPVIDTHSIPPDAELYKANGKVSITVNCVTPTKTIRLHASDKIVIQTSEVFLEGTSTPLTVDDTSRGPEEDFYTILMVDELLQGRNYVVSIDFVAPVDTGRVDLDGLYLSPYTPPGEVDPRPVAVTQFAAKAARKAFPCFDEPGFKTKFDIKIGRTENYTALSNSELLRSDAMLEDGYEGWFLDTFDQTVNMSTYLVAIVISDYAFVEADLRLPDGQPVRVYAPKHLIDRDGGVYASKTSAQVMTFFENYFNLAYKMPKMDSAIVPDFYFGAMENWGLITYRELYLMYYEGESTEAERQKISSIVAHESSHQWFGNIITCKWWNHVWLNEGFATYLSFIGSNHTDPEFESLKGFLNDAFQYSMTFDTDPAYSHPIRSPDSINAPLYDRINYEKGASLIRMMEGFLTPATLKKALQIFLANHEFKAVVQDDLFYILTQEGHNDDVIPVDLTVKDIMDTWTRQSGYPLIRVSKGFATNTVQISQERFKEGLLPGDLDRNDLWYVPISIATQDSPNFSDHRPKFWLDKRAALRTHNHDVTKWIMINPDATGYYRVLYDTPLWTLIKKQLDTDPLVISPASRSQLLDDYFTMAFEGFFRIETSLELTTFLDKESEKIVWNALFTKLERTSRMLAGHGGFDSFREYILPKIGAAIQRLGFNQPAGEIGVKVLLRLQLLDWACKLQMDSCLEFSSNLFAEWQKNPANNPIPIDLQPVVYCAGVGNGGVDAFDFALKQYQDISTTEKQKQMLLNALACTKETFLLQTLLDQSLEDTFGFSNATRIATIQKVFQNSVGRQLTITFIREKFIKILELGEVKEFSSFFASLGQYCTTPTELAEIENFANEYKAELDDEAIAAVLKSAISSIQSNIDWRKSYYQSMDEWFKIQNTK